MRFHLHKYKIETEIIKGHKHRLFGYAGNMLGLESFHFHFFYGVCSYDNHTHYFSGVTGMPVKTENGHVHRMDGILETNISHQHSYDGYTTEEISYFSSRQSATYVQ
jgi:hypothetical protein